MSEPTFTISADGRAITCHRCGLTSHHPMDVNQRYCGNCKLFHTDAAAANTNLLLENAELRRRLDAARHAGDMAHARMAALVEACEATAAFIESYPPGCVVEQTLPTFYANLRVYGKNARAAVTAVRPQADALLAELAAARAVVDALRRHPGCMVDDPILDAAMDAMDEATKARGI